MPVKDKFMPAVVRRNRERRKHRRTVALFSQAENMWRTEIERLREALRVIVCNTEPAAFKHRDYDHLARAMYVWARAALGEDK